MEIRSYGAAHTVTGSCHLVEDGEASLLLDCGAFQGSDELFALNANPFGFDPASVDAMMLSHAHLDHCGRIPLLVKRGFRGQIHALPATRLFVEHLLLDAAKLQREERERDARKGRPSTPPLYDETDVGAVLERFVPLAYDTQTEIAGFAVTAQRAGHIPGSASVLLERDGSRLVFSGDLGNIRKDVLPDPPPCPEADIVAIESTYGDRDHRGFEETLAEFATILGEAAERGGKILIPSFALERTHDVLYHIARLEEAHRIPRLAVYVDSPLAMKVDAVYDACPDEFSDDVRRIAISGRDPFAPSHLRYSRTVDESKQINASREAAIVIAGSGMLTGGRILHHLRAHLDEPSTTVVIVGFQPTGGLGRRLVDGADSVRVMGQEVRVRARVATIGGFSAHADRTELLAWSASAGPKAEFRLVHGEPSASESLRDAIRARGGRAELQRSEIALPGPGRRDEGGE